MEIEGRDAFGRHDVIFKVVFIFITGPTLEFGFFSCLAKYLGKDPIPHPINIAS